MQRIAFTSALVALSCSLNAQSHEQGTWQFCLGASLGVHATHFEWKYSFDLLGVPISVSDEEDDGAATTTFPFEVHYGLADRFSLGLYVEPGRYLDSADNNPNRIILVGLSPRYYIINNDRFNWTAMLDLGAGGLEISDKEETITDSYAGGHLRIGSGVSFYFGEHFGLQLFGKYAAYNLKWRDREPDDLPENYEAKLTTSGFHFGAGLTFKL